MMKLILEEEFREIEWHKIHPITEMPREENTSENSTAASPPACSFPEKAFLSHPKDLPSKPFSPISLKRLNEARISVTDTVQNLTAVAQENAASTQESAASVNQVSDCKSSSLFSCSCRFYGCIQRQKICLFCNICNQFRGLPDLLCRTILQLKTKQLEIITNIKEQSNALKNASAYLNEKTTVGL